MAVEIKIGNGHTDVAITGEFIENVKHFCILFEKYPIVKDFLKTTIDAHDEFLKDQAKKAEQAKNN